MAGTIISRKGEPTFRQDHPKTARSRRPVALPSFTARRYADDSRDRGNLEPDDLLFQSREGTPLSTANVRCQLRHVLQLGCITGITSHMFRRTAATAINDVASVELATELLCHTDPKITIQHYIRRNEMVNPTTAEILDRAFAREE